MTSTILTFNLTRGLIYEIKNVGFNDDGLGY
jgi:hypothetical protein